MPEAVATPAAAPTTPAPNTPPVAKADAKPDAAPAWGPDDDKAFEALAKKRGLKVKANGQEMPITSMEGLLKEFEFSSKGRGATKLAEEAKAEREAAKSERAEAQRLKLLHEAARKGDYNARVELGLVAPDEAASRDAELAALPPEVRQMLEANAKMEQELAELRAERERQTKEAEESRMTAQKTELRKQATGFLQKVFESAGLDLKDDAAEARPFLAATYQAMREFADAGMDIAADTTAELVTRRIMELREESSTRSFGKLKAGKRLELVRPVLEDLATRFSLPQPTAQASELIEAVGPKAARAIARAVAQMQRTSKAVPAKPATPEAPAKEQPKKPEPLRFGGPWLGNGR